MSKTTVTMEKVGPTEAAAMLEGNIQNRNLKQRVITAYARDMMTGRWSDQGDPIRLNGDGTLLDGQHRLHAIIESKVTLELIVVRGVSKKSILTMDTGARRTFSDVLKLNGYINCTQLAATSRFLMLYEQGFDIRYKQPFTNSEMIEWIESNSNITSHVHKVMGQSGPIIGRVRTPLAAIRFLAADKSDADAFADNLRTGADLTEGSALHTLRRTLENAMLSKQMTVVPVATQAMVVKAWNAYLRGDSVQVLRFKPGGEAPEQFPKILTEA